MRFVFISSMFGYPWGGSEELWSQSAQQLKMDGQSVAASVAYWSKPSPQITKLSEHGINLFIRKPARDTMLQKVWRKFTRQQRKQEELIWLRRQNPDLVVISQGSNQDGLEWMKFCHESELPFVAIVQCNTEHWWPWDDKGLKMATAYQAARKVFCVSRRNLELLEYQIGASLPNGEVVFNPYNVSPNQRPAWPKVSDICRLACVARLEPAAKGQDLLLQIIALPQWRNRSVEINLYGAGSWERSLQNLANRLHLKNIRFCGHVTNVARIWEDNHILVLPSRYEGTPLALVEAMWCERPAVVTDVGGNAELCVNGETGFVAPAPAVGLFAQTLEQAWDRRKEWQAMGKAARARAEQLIPRDPVGEFCQSLKACASSMAK